jgi:ElaB/YqjD/DUF883 family membrane-anchored ribosome-binding protein
MSLMLMAGFLLSLTGSSLWADNPETDRSAANFDNKETGALQHTKDGANRALNGVDSGVHKTGRGVKSGARKAKKKTNDALNSADKSIHKAGHEASDAGNHALDKVDDTVHGR